MKRLVLALAIVGALIVPSAASAAEVSPEAQAMLDREGATLVPIDPPAEDASATGARPRGICPYNGRAKIYGHKQRAYSGATEWAHYEKLVACLNRNKTKIIKRRCVHNHRSPSSKWDFVDADFGCGSQRTWGFITWSHPVVGVEQWWESQVRIVAHVRPGDGIYFTKGRAFR
jgi:hypothetical protein